MKFLAFLSRITVTLVVTAAALGAGWWLWDYYMNQPWTRDGRVRADIVQVSSDVAGLVTEVKVADNQPVRKGDVLFLVDPGRYKLAVEQAEANLQSARAELSYRKAEANRYSQLGSNVVSTAQRQEVESAMAKAAAAARQSEAALDLAHHHLTGLVRHGLVQFHRGGRLIGRRHDREVGVAVVAQLTEAGGHAAVGGLDPHVGRGERVGLRRGGGGGCRGGAAREGENGGGGEGADAQGTKGHEKPFRTVRRARRDGGGRRTR